MSRPHPLAYCSLLPITVSLAVGCMGEDEPRVGLTVQAFKIPEHESITDDALIFLKSDVKTRIREKHWDVDHYQQANPSFHFDGCQFVESVAQINDGYANYVLPALDPSSPDHELAQESFGAILHTVQDFYAHSNWVELKMLAPLPLGSQGPLLTMPDLVDDGLGPWRAISSASAPGTNLSFVQRSLPLPNGVRPVRPLPNGTFPLDRLVVLQRANQVVGYGLMSGTTGYAIAGAVLPTVVPGVVPPVPLPIDNCTSGAQLSHFTSQGLNKDELGRPGYQEARTAAQRQSRHEWCRLVSLVRGEHGVAGDFDLYETWVDNVEAARCGDEVDIVAIPDTAPPATQKLAPSSSQTLQFKVANQASGASAYGVTWKVSFSGAIASIGSATMGNVACEVSGSTAACKASDVLAGGADETIEVSITPGSPGTISATATASSHNPDADASNDEASFAFVVECPAGQTWDGQQCSAMGTISGSLTVAENCWCLRCRPSSDGRCRSCDLACDISQGASTMVPIGLDDGDGILFDNEGNWDEGDIPVEGVVTDAAGEFSAQLPAGSYWLELNFSGFLADGTGHPYSLFVLVTVQAGQTISGIQAWAVELGG